jgi:hypothetical protein
MFIAVSEQVLNSPISPFKHGEDSLSDKPFIFIREIK